MKQLHDINKHGEYTFSATKDSQECSVSLTIISDDPFVLKKFWTLSDLHEIKSKLVLITHLTSRWANSIHSFQEV